MNLSEGIDFKQLMLDYRKNYVELMKLSVEFKKNYIAKSNSYNAKKYEFYRRACREIKIKILTHKFFIEYCAYNNVTDDSFIQIVELLLKHKMIDFTKYQYGFFKRMAWKIYCML